MGYGMNHSDMMEKMDNFVKMLQARFPLMYENTFDVWIQPGWQPIVSTLSIAIQQHIDLTNQQIKCMEDRGQTPTIQRVTQVTVAQVKEKFGTLRFYYDGGDDYIDGLVEMAEHWAGNTCEECGKPGHLRYDLPWHKTLCEEHYEIRKRRP